MNNPSEHVISVDQEIQQVNIGKPHIIILGAGASVATTLSSNGDKNEKQLPTMANFIQVVGLEEILDEIKIDYKDKNFEVVYESINKDRFKKEVLEINKKIVKYFANLKLSDKPTIYDHLVLALRKKDLIATFNWDPFLLQAFRRNKEKGVELPQLAFLHGNVEVGFCLKDGVSGINGNSCSKCGERFTPSDLLYPITQKNYSDGKFIENEWSRLRLNLKNAFMITVFGYSAPKTDTEAIGTMKKVWGDVNKRNMEQFEIISRPDNDPEALENTWNNFIHTHHYDVLGDFYNSWMANHPRRTGEAWWNQNFEAKFVSKNPIPKDLEFPELWKWFRSLGKAEKK